MKLHDVQQDFPLLYPQQNQKKVIYLDSACQSLRPRQVIDAVSEYYNRYPACSGRSNHHLGEMVTSKVDDTRQRIAAFLGASHKEEIIFTRNTTEGINLVSNSLAFNPGDVVLITGKEHNSNLIPWQRLARLRGVVLKVIPSPSDGSFNIKEYESLLTPAVKLVAVGYTSNLDGTTLPVEQIIKLAHKRGALVLLDAAQAAPHRKINIRALDVDFLALSGHKMLGPSGTGVLFGKRTLLEKMDPFLVGGDTVGSSTYETADFLPVPEKFEAGLQDYAGIIGLGEAVRYLNSIGFDAIQKQELIINKTITEGCGQIEGLHLIGPADPVLRGGIFTFYIEGIDSHRIALMLDQMGQICVRSGQHCVHSWFHANKIAGSVRASAYFYNTIEDAEIFIENLKKIRKVL